MSDFHCSKCPTLLGVLTCARWIVVLALLGLISQPTRGQAHFYSMIGSASVKSVLEVDTPAGKTRVLLASSDEAPRWVVLFAPGGEGHVDFSANSLGEPTSARPGNPAFMFAREFLIRHAAWAIVAVPGSYGLALTETQRLDAQHIEAVSNVARRLREAYPHAKLILVGHSNGGITAGLQAIQPQPAVDAVVMSAPNLKWLPFRWEARVRVPILFITHKDDACASTAAHKTIYAAGDKFPVAVIESPSRGNRGECSNPPAPHFFSDAYAEYADAILRWAATLESSQIGR